MAAKHGNLSINSDNIFPIIKKWMYSDHDIFVRELVSNGCDAITKLKKLDGMGEYQLPEDYKACIRVIVNPEEKTLKFIDNGIGMTTDEVEEYITNFYRDETYEHMVAPGMVYISHPTEFGTLYTLDELEALSNVCRKAEIPLYLDGARLGYGLASPNTDVALTDIARLCDVFYIGGTKVGALFGEAVVARDHSLLRHFTPLVKQHGALLAKGRLLGIQFEALFTDNLYQHIGTHAIEMAMKLKEAFIVKGYRLHIDSPTNQQFVCLSNATIDRLAENATFELWGPRGEKETVVRFVTSWATREEDVDALISLL